MNKCYRIPLIAVSIQGHTNVAKLLLTYNASVNKSNTYGWTPLHAAAWYDRDAIVELLCYSGAHVNAQTCEVHRLHTNVAPG